MYGNFLSDVEGNAHLLCDLERFPAFPCFFIFISLPFKTSRAEMSLKIIAKVVKNIDPPRKRSAAGRYFSFGFFLKTHFKRI